MSRDKTRSLMRRLVVLKAIEDADPEGGMVVGHEQGWPITPELERMEKEGLIERWRTPAIPKRSLQFRLLRSWSGGAAQRLTKFRITPAGREKLRERYDPQEAEMLLSTLFCGDASDCPKLAGCSLLCRIAFAQGRTRSSAPG